MMRLWRRPVSPPPVGDRRAVDRDAALKRELDQREKEIRARIRALRAEVAVMTRQAMDPDDR